METWKYEDMEIRRHENIETWEQGDMYTWRHRDLKHRDMETWRNGNMKTWRQMKHEDREIKTYTWIDGQRDMGVSTDKRRTCVVIMQRRCFVRNQQK
jgi:hypothetical protein